MKTIQVYFIYQSEIQFYDYNATEESDEFRFQNVISELRKTLEILGRGGFYLKCPTSLPNTTHQLHEL
jgi:hypothetical protein